MQLIGKDGRRFPLAYLGKDAARRPAVIRSGSDWFTAGYVSDGQFHNIAGQNGPNLDSLICLAQLFIEDAHPHAMLE